MTWTGQTFTSGQVLTAAQMNNLQADITAQANGDSGAPQNQTASIANLAVTEAKLAASAVSQGKLATSTGSISRSTDGNSTLPGGEYGFYPQTKVTGATSISFYVAYVLGSTSYATNIGVDIVSGSGSGQAQQRYITASPPYDLGDGEIPMFIYALIDKTNGNILGTYIAPEAPWHNNGPTSIRAEVYRDGVGYRNVKVIPPQFQARIPEIAQIRSKINLGETITQDQVFLLRDFFQAMKDQPFEEQVIDQSIKNADMELIPHPFPGYDSANQEVILLDPLSAVTERLFEMNKYDEAGFEILSLFDRGAFTIDNQPLTRNGPQGVKQVSFNWRNTP